MDGRTIPSRLTIPRNSDAQSWLNLEEDRAPPRGPMIADETSAGSQSVSRNTVLHDHRKQSTSFAGTLRRYITARAASPPSSRQIATGDQNRKLAPGRAGSQG